jgi:CRISPR-associated endonuclease/helicase Cas3
MYKLHLQAVDSRNATQDELDAAGIDASQIPEGWKLAAHQAETVRALRFGDVPIIINQAMTGDGKTLSGWFQLLSQKWRSFAMYPTNALAHDQKQGFDDLMRVWKPPNWNGKIPKEKLISAYEIDQHSFGVNFKVSRKDDIEALMRHKDYILTNPDIFHLIMNFTYKQQGEASDFLPTFVVNLFRLYIFDEFHLFGIEQTAAVMIAMLLIKQLEPQAEARKFLFLSATPQNQLRQLATRVNLDIANPINGVYEHGRPQISDGYRRILRAADLSLYSGDLEEWVKEHFEDIIKPFFLNHKDAATGLIIANSVATAHRIHAYLKPLCQGFINVEINTGLTPKADKTDKFNLLVATSTVDVGVDFKINFLVFESRDAASHTQRLGRLGRHEKDKHGNLFQTYEAHALLPMWVIEGLMQKYAEEDTVSREEYKKTVEEYYAPQQQFADYVHRWAGVQAGKLLKELRDNSIYTQYQRSHERLEKHFKALFGKSVKKYFALAKEGSKEIIQAVSSFRGGSPFMALIQDPETDSKQIVSYNLMSLLRRADLQAVPIESLLKEAKKHNRNIESLEKTEPLAAYRLLGWRDDYRDIIIKLDTELPSEKYETVIEQNRFCLDCAGIPELQALNENLYDRILVAFVIPNKDPHLVRRLLRLGFQTELFDFSGSGALQGTIVFGRDALLVDSVLRRGKAQDAFIW